ncbi:hypothetical protein QP986_04355 [Corynebacterium striatum]|uniref:hypothetical protein n=1 Tax=Corynebacterium striatum TaxID=43770 RepID=UPI001661DC7E|nr:hypothetical protein [Corynebacterium striatum]MBD0853394.1 hypothetical protein [Corynebacterium striatum]MDK8843305.1 hypothetical protein [Corynebacterium striatum]
MQKITRRFTAGLAAASLSLALVACSDAEDAANSAGDAAKSAANEATEKAGSAVADATGAKGSESESEGADADPSDAANASEGADASEGKDGENAAGKDSGEKKTINTPAGDFEVPAAFASAIEEKAGEWGDVQSIENTDAGSLATFAEDKLLAFSEESGAQPIIGKIAETWKGEGGLANKVGLPTAPEQAEGNGWVQKFTNGTIKWMKGASGEYEATVE